MQSLLHFFLQDPLWVGLFLDAGLVTLALIFPALAGVLLNLRRLIQASLRQERAKAIEELIPLFDQLPIENPTIQQMAQEMGQELVSSLLERYEPPS